MNYLQVNCQDELWLKWVFIDLNQEEWRLDLYQVTNHYHMVTKTFNNFMYQDKELKVKG